jgi:predicted amidohydrolase YtcJ
VKGGSVTSANLVLIEGNVLTMNPAKPCAEAVAVKGDRIVKVGSNEEINQLVVEDTQVIRLKGKTVVPGFIDTHIHVADFGRLLTWIDLSNASSIEDMQSSLRRHVKKTPKGKWLLGRGWNQKLFAEKRLPTRFDLDAVSPDNPVVFYRQTGQMCVVNSLALQLAGVTEGASAPQSGVIDRDTVTGKLTGVLRESATNLIWPVIPDPSEEELMDAAGLAVEKIVEAGVTSVHWMGMSSIELSVIRTLHAQKRLPIRVYVIIPVNLLDEIIGFGLPDDPALRIGGALISADGYLAARTASLSKPYSDAPEESGNLLCTQEELLLSAARILNMGLQLVIHSMGDRAVGAALTVIEEVSREVLQKGFRSRIEQAAVLNRTLIENLKEQKVIVSVQPCVAASEFSVWSATEHLGPERARWLYPLKTLLKEGIKVVAGSDCPMEPLSPLLGIQTAVMRASYPEERITVDEALRLYTIDAAFSSSEEDIKGSIETGKLADLTILSSDPHKVSPNEIKDIAVEMTIIGGRVFYPKR